MRRTHFRFVSRLGGLTFASDAATKAIDLSSPRRTPVVNFIWRKWSCGLDGDSATRASDATATTTSRAVLGGSCGTGLDGRLALAEVAVRVESDPLTGAT
jgi:hypothetical protein